MKKRLWLIMALGPFFVSPALADEAPGTGQREGMAGYKAGSFICGHNKHALMKELPSDFNSDHEKKAEPKSEVAL